MTVPPVSDHAVLRYLERAKGFDLEKVRQHIASLCAAPVKAGANCVRVEGVKFEITDGRVVTCTPGGGGCNRIKRARLAVRPATTAPALQTARPKA
jgi:hypothetical protein